MTFIRELLRQKNSRIPVYRVGKVKAYNGNATYRVEIEGVTYEQVASLSGGVFRAGEAVRVDFRDGRAFIL